MTLGDPDEVWFDTATLLSLVFAEHTLRLLQGGVLAGRAKWAEAVEEELRRLAASAAPPPRINNVRRDTAWLGEPVVPDGQQHGDVQRCRDAVAIPDHHPEEHLGEAQSVVLARDAHRARVAGSGATSRVTIVASDDRDTAAVLRAARADEGVRLWTTAHLLAYLVQADHLDCDDAYHDYERMTGQGARKGMPRGLTREELCTGDIPPPRR